MSLHSSLVYCNGKFGEIHRIQTTSEERVAQWLAVVTGKPRVPVSSLATGYMFLRRVEVTGRS